VLLFSCKTPRPGAFLVGDFSQGRPKMTQVVTPRTKSGRMRRIGEGSEGTRGDKSFRSIENTGFGRTA
jgi:hypothetical protein